MIDTDSGVLPGAMKLAVPLLTKEQRKREKRRAHKQKIAHTKRMRRKGHEFECPVCLDFFNRYGLLSHLYVYSCFHTHTQNPCLIRARRATHCIVIDEDVASSLLELEVVDFHQQLKKLTLK